ncbi:hypothetical protein GCM10007887_19080 [Methylobacterium haplocladii]|nr:hypothetical protein GCM10007887_19080 [Methylobacterium haplocladii]
MRRRSPMGHDGSTGADVTFEASSAGRRSGRGAWESFPADLRGSLRFRESVASDLRTKRSDRAAKSPMSPGRSWRRNVGTPPDMARNHSDPPAIARRPSCSTRKPTTMNPVALATMASIMVGFTAALLYALSTGTAWFVALLVILAVALFVKWR